MIFVDKQRTTPSVFIQATAGLTDYNQLSGTNKQIVIELLLAEQGGLCPLCEREDFGPTLEHYLPRSENPALQLDYHNLYVCCQPCNGPKATHLIPPYIFDRRYDPCGVKHPITQNEGVYQHFEISCDEHCFLKVPASVFPPDKAPKPANMAGVMLHYTFVFTDQNRQGPDHANLVKARGQVAKRIREAFAKLSDFQIQQAWDGIVNARSTTGYRFPAFVSLHLQLLSKERTRRGI
jgi:hypothetical protein